MQQQLYLLSDDPVKFLQMTQAELAITFQKNTFEALDNWELFSLLRMLDWRYLGSTLIIIPNATSYTILQEGSVLMSSISCCNFF